MADINHRIGIAAPISTVYHALSTIEGLAGWWTRNTTGEATPGGKIDFRFLNADGSLKGGFLMSVVSHEPGKKVQWKVVEGPQDWIGTDLIFSLSETDGQTILLFSHKNWPVSNEHMAHCSMKWATFLLSLKQLAETGKGRPSPDDLKIDNWN